MTEIIEKIRNSIVSPDSKLLKIINATGVGYIACKLFIRVNPAAAALFSATTELTKIFVDNKFKETRTDLIKGLIIRGSCIAIGSFATNFVLPISSSDALKLSAIAMISKVALKIFWH